MKQALLKLSILATLMFSISSHAAELDLSKYKGKVIYLDFWASWCGPCKESFPWLNQLQKDHPNIKIIGINLDKNKIDAEKFLKSNPADFEIIYNPEANLANTFKVKGMPYSVIFNKDGKPIFNHIGFSAKKSNKYVKEIESLLESK
jgi:thiol-disulfide isomerase/thioredoxin